MIAFQCRLFRWYPGAIAGYVARNCTASPGSRLTLPMLRAYPIPADPEKQLVLHCRLVKSWGLPLVAGGRL
jgi:hypothetical protein